MDLAQCCEHEGADEAPGLWLRLVARGNYLPARILQVEPVVLLEVIRAWPGVSQKEPGELVSQVCDRPSQRAGCRRMLLASRRHSRRAARTRAMVPAHHEIR